MAIVPFSWAPSEYWYFVLPQQTLLATEILMSKKGR